MRLLLLTACGALPRPPAETTPSLTAAEAFVLAGGTVVGVGPADVEVEGARIVAIGGASSDAVRVDVSGQWLVPAVIDSHVHLAYLPDAEGMADGGVAAAVDLAAPSAFLSEDHAPLRILAAGPMITAPGGYPTQGWGRDGYGLEVSDAEDAVAAVDALHAAGARIVKLPLDGGPRLSDDALNATVTRAHALGMRVAVHALGDEDAALGAAIDADLLAHTPTGALSLETVEAWADGAVVSTLGAFGGTDVAVANLSALRDAGATVLYGTDFGNTRAAGVDPRELALLAEAGLSPAEILAAATSVPAEYWGFEGLGALAVDSAASVLVLPADPALDPLALSDATLTLIDGAPRGLDP